MGYDIRRIGFFKLSRELTVREARDVTRILRREKPAKGAPDSDSIWDVTEDRAGICGPEDSFKDYEDEAWLTWLIGYFAAKKITMEGRIRWEGEDAADVGEWRISVEDGKSELTSLQADIVIDRSAFVDAFLARTGLDGDLREMVYNALWETFDEWTEDEPAPAGGSFDYEED